MFLSRSAQPPGLLTPTDSQPIQLFCCCFVCNAETTTNIVHGTLQQKKRIVLCPVAQRRVGVGGGGGVGGLGGWWRG